MGEVHVRRFLPPSAWALKAKAQQFLLIPCALAFSLCAGSEFSGWGNCGTALREDVKGIVVDVVLNSWLWVGSWTRLASSSPFQPLPLHPSVECLTWTGWKGKSYTLADSCLWAPRILKRAFLSGFVGVDSNSRQWMTTLLVFSWFLCADYNAIMSLNVAKSGDMICKVIFCVIFCIHICKNVWQFDCLLY